VEDHVSFVDREMVPIHTHWIQNLGGFFVGIPDQGLMTIDCNNLQLKNNKNVFLRLSVAGPGCLSRIQIFFYPGSRSKRWFRIPVPDPHQISQRFLTLKAVSKLSEKLPGKFIPDPVFFHPGSRGQKGAGSRSRIRNTASAFFFELVSFLPCYSDRVFFIPKQTRLHLDQNHSHHRCRAMNRNPWPNLSPGIGAQHTINLKK
jgi:hypothetical protein